MKLLAKSSIDKMLSPAELAAYLGVSIGTIYGWTHLRVIPFYKVGNLVRFKLAEVEQWLADNRVEPYNRS